MRARAMQQNGDARRLGEILVGINAISERELIKQVRRQSEEVVFELMSWSEGYFSFQDRPVAEAPAEALIRTPVGFLLMEAARRIDEWSRIEKRIPHLGIVPVFAPAADGAGSLDLLPDEWELLGVVDGGGDVRALASALGRPEFDVAKTLFGLASAGIIVLEDPATRRAAAPSAGGLTFQIGEAEAHLVAGDVAGALRAAESAVAAHEHQALASLVYGRALLAAHRYEEAAEALWRAAELDSTSPAALRYLGYAQAALGQFREAGDSWERWANQAAKPPEEDAQAVLVERARQAALTLDLVLRSAHE
jgi:tetratricopeptide (TPR) repeat protein